MDISQIRNIIKDNVTVDKFLPPFFVMKADVERETSLIEENISDLTNVSGVIEIVETPMDTENIVPEEFGYFFFIIRIFYAWFF